MKFFVFYLELIAKKLCIHSQPNAFELSSFGLLINMHKELRPA